MKPCPHAAAQMAAFDAMPAQMRDFLNGHALGLKATYAARLLRDVNGDAAEAIECIRILHPVKDA